MPVDIVRRFIRWVLMIIVGKLKQPYIWIWRINRAGAYFSGLIKVSIFLDDKI